MLFLLHKKAAENRNFILIHNYLCDSAFYQHFAMELRWRFTYDLRKEKTDGEYPSVLKYKALIMQVP